jgi:hypothetical protein
MDRDAPLRAALSQRLAVKRIAQATGITSQAVSRWHRVPERWLEAVAYVTGMPKEVLRPDLFPRRTNAAAPAQPPLSRGATE